MNLLDIASSITDIKTKEGGILVDILSVGVGEQCPTHDFSDKHGMWACDECGFMFSVIHYKDEKLSN